MNKYQLALGLTVSIVFLAILMLLAFLLQLKAGELHSSTFALLGWVSGIVGLFVAGSADKS